MFLIILVKVKYINNVVVSKIIINRTKENIYASLFEINQNSGEPTERLINFTFTNSYCKYLMS